MDTSTGADKSCASNEYCLPLTIAPPRDGSATPRPPSGHASVTDDHGTPLPNLEQPILNTNNCVIIIQNNYIAEGGTINILSSRCNGSTMTKLNHVTTTTEATPLQPPSAKQAEPAEYSRESIVLSGNTFGECVMINVGSPDCTGAGRSFSLSGRADALLLFVPVKQTALASQTSPI
ncbi:hypothetical protein EDB19DRAFT_772216 [Suillus lakei]|nr:hypothetical protein EDB19DRAFT_772216 [Suillus lakei]